MLANAAKSIYIECNYQSKCSVNLRQVFVLLLFTVAEKADY